MKAAVTALCLSTLIELNDPAKDVQEAIHKGERWLLDELPKVRRATADAIYNVWTHAYAIQALLRLYDGYPSRKKRQEQILALIQQQIQALEKTECLAGGWAYYDFRAKTYKPSGSPPSFTTSTILIALYEAKERFELKLSKTLIQRAIKTVQRQRKP